MPETIEPAARALLEAVNFSHVSTLQPDGSIHTAVTWVDVDGEHVLVNSAEGRRWPTNLERDPHVTVSVHSQENPYEYVSIRGKVVERTHDGADEHIDKMAKKYIDRDEYPFRRPGEQRVLFRIEPEHVFHVKQG